MTVIRQRVQVDITVIIEVRATCPACGRSIYLRRASDAGAIAAEYIDHRIASKDVVKELSDAMDDRGWTRDTCGRCRDSDDGCISDQTRRPDAEIVRPR